MHKNIIRPALLTAVAAASAFSAELTLPSTGVDTGGYTNALLQNLGGVIGQAIGAGFAIFAIWMGFRYVKSAIRGR